MHSPMFLMPSNLPPDFNIILAVTLLDAPRLKEFKTSTFLSTPSYLIWCNLALKEPSGDIWRLNLYFTQGPFSNAPTPALQISFHYSVPIFFSCFIWRGPSLKGEAMGMPQVLHSRYSTTPLHTFSQRTVYQWRFPKFGKKWPHPLGERQCANSIQYLYKFITFYINFPLSALTIEATPTFKK